ncbi:hypothetical protein D3C80_1997390 [compost metagenome]
MLCPDLPGGHGADRARTVELQLLLCRHCPGDLFSARHLGTVGALFAVQYRLLRAVASGAGVHDRRPAD